MGEMILKHNKHPAHHSSMATGVALSGPSPDGFVHLTFYRDAIELVEEHFETAPGEVEGTVHLRPVDGSLKTTLSREDVVTLLVPAGKFKSFASALQRMVAVVESHPTESPKD